jgi:hypothetical protein
VPIPASAERLDAADKAAVAAALATATRPIELTARTAGAVENAEVRLKSDVVEENGLLSISLELLTESER